MSVVTTPREQRRIAEAARKVGGYDELARLSDEWRRAIARGDRVRFDEVAKEWASAAPPPPPSRPVPRK